MNLSVMRTYICFRVNFPEVVLVVICLILVITVHPVVVTLENHKNVFRKF